MSPLKDTIGKGIRNVYIVPIFSILPNGNFENTTL